MDQNSCNKFLRRLSSALVLGLMALTETANTQIFDVNTFTACMDRCVEKGHYYYSNPQGTAGQCCSNDELPSYCDQGGTTTVGHTQMPQFACPTNFRCGARRLFAHKYSQTYSLLPSLLSYNNNVCNHEITFSNDAGINDVLKVEFLSVSPTAIVNFAVGETFETAKGSSMVSAEGQTI